MDHVEERLARSLTAESTELIPYLSYLLQDLWELGSSPRDMADLLSRHADISPETRILDLACGKGAVSVHLAREFGCRVTGVDLMEDFITEAREQAEAQGLSGRCSFSAGDINHITAAGGDYDIVILGAVGDVLGSPLQTITQLKRTICPEGYILIDDGFAFEEGMEGAYTRDYWLGCCETAGVRLLDELCIDDEELREINEQQQGHIRRRAEELAAQHPEKKELFEGYLRSQQEECDMLEQEIVGVTMLLQDAAGEIS